MQETSLEVFHDRIEPNLRFLQLVVLKALRAVKPEGLTDEELYEKISHTDLSSTYRSRRAELVKLGLVVPTGERRLLKNGNYAKVWRAV